MPRLKDLDRFKSDLAALSHEDEILTRWGEKREYPPLPEGAAENEAAASPASSSKHSPPTPKASARPKAVEAPDEGLPPDFATLLAGLPLEEEPPESEPISSPEAAEIPSAEASAGEEAEDLGDLGDLDLESLDEAAPAVPGAVDEKPPAEQEAPTIDEIPEVPTEPSSDDFSMPDLGSFEIDAGSPPLGEETLGTETLEGEGLGALPAGETAPESADFEGFGSMDDFSLPGESPAPGTRADDISIPTTDDFSIPDMGGGFGDDATSLGAMTGESSGAGGAESPMPDLGAKAGDSFDNFSFDDGSLGGADLDSQLAALGDEVSPAATFNLDKDWGAGFEIPGEEEKKPAKEQAAVARPEPASHEKVREVSLTEEEVDKLQDRLLSLPLNLRLAVEDSVANGLGTEAQRSKLVWALVERKPFDEVAALVSKIIKRRITVPTGYEKSTGAAFVAEKGSFRYLFVHSILPILKAACLVLVAAGILGFLGYKFVYRPLAADRLYRSGYARIGQDRYAEAEASFARATKMHEYIRWYYRYAEAYAAKRQYLLAERKYSDLLAFHPDEKRAPSLGPSSKRSSSNSRTRPTSSTSAYSNASTTIKRPFSSSETSISTGPRKNRRTTRMQEEVMRPSFRSTA